ncbi:MAG: SpoIIIAH-like family protein [Clostridia bacterium]|nr:SpoIIIAH-like family protein [Clostridia bacterium]MBR6783608.1 SpoIIIAH-like family protein [Clostridia bacterium]
MNIKKRLQEITERLKKTDWKKLIATKAFITVGCVMLVCAAVLVSTLINGGENDLPVDDGNRVLGNTLLADSSAAEDSNGESSAESGENVNANPETAEDFFAMAIINRTQVRDSALEVLREIAESPDTLPDAKEDALASIAGIADDMSAEANIETLVKAKGISDCVAVISGESCSVIVNQSGLLPDELTQITDIVYEQTGIPVTNITVVEAKS